MKRLIFIFSLGLFTVACQSNDSQATDNSSATAPTTELADKTANTPTTETPASNAKGEYAIETRQFYGVALGRDIADYPNKLEKGILKNGEGEFEIYYIKDTSGEQLGYANTTPLDKSKISSITITSAKGQTKEGARVGMEFQKLESLLGDLQVFGSEIEGRTFAVKENLQFFLDAANFQYKVDKSTIAATTKVKSITINSIMIY